MGVTVGARDAQCDGVETQLRAAAGVTELGAVLILGIPLTHARTYLPQNHETVYVNRAPYLPYSGVVGIVSAQVDSTQQQAAYDFLIFLAQNNLQMALSPESTPEGGKLADVGWLLVLGLVLGAGGMDANEAARR